MSEGKYEKAAVKNGGKGKKTVAVMAAVSLLLALAVGGTVAYIAAKSALIKNQFQPAQVSCEVETNGDTIKVENTSDVSAYIRAAVVVNWMDASGNVYGIAPKDSEYKLQYGGDWQKVGDFYYYKAKVSAPVSKKDNDKVFTAPLINGITVTGTAPDGYTLTVEVVAEAIQAEGLKNGVKAVEDAWGVDPESLKGGSGS